MKKWSFPVAGQGRLSTSADPYVVRRGKLVSLEGMPKSQPPAGVSSKRGVATFSAPSRRRLLRLVASVNGAARPVFLTLTYGREWPRQPALWKVHLDRFLKRLTRDGFSGFWKLEPQKRGAPHFHLLVYGGRVPKGWLARAWAECSEDESPDHLKAGTRVESILSSNGAMYYTAKYMGKGVEPKGDEWARAGRWWGVFNRAKVPWAPKRVSSLSSDGLKVVLSVIRNAHSKRALEYPNVVFKSAFIEPEHFQKQVKAEAHRLMRGRAESLARRGIPFDLASRVAGLVSEILLDS